VVAVTEEAAQHDRRASLTQKAGSSTSSERATPKNAVCHLFRLNCGPHRIASWQRRNGKKEPAVTLQPSAATNGLNMLVSAVSA
jgi:hypothetical protein